MFLEEIEKEIERETQLMQTMDTNSEEYQKKLNSIIKLSGVANRMSKSKEVKKSLDEENFEFQKIQADINNDMNERKLSAELDKELRQEEKESKERKIRLILGILGIIVSPTVQVISLIFYHRLAVRTLAMEYIDNGVSPRLFGESMQNVNQFIKN